MNSFQIVECPSYTHPIPDEVWEGFPNLRGQKVFVKPNLVMPPTIIEFQSCTHVAVVEAVVRKSLDAGAESVWIGDCGFKNQWRKTVELSGYARLRQIAPKQIRLIGLQEKSNFHQFSLIRSEPGYLSLFGARISNYVLDCDCIIDVPKLKVHSLAGITGAIKNLMGIMAQKGSMHPRGSSEILHKRLADFYFLLRDRVSFCIMDGIVGSEWCEQTGCPVSSGIVTSCVDPWTMDTVAAHIIGLDPDRIGYLRYIKQRLGRDWPSVDSKFLIHTYELPLAWR